MIDATKLGDIDIDTGDRHRLLMNLVHVPATVQRNGTAAKHNTGVYFHNVPQDPFQQWCSVNYQAAEHMGCYKIDLLNNSVYQSVRDENHLQRLMETPPMWELLDHAEVVSELAHIGQHFDLVSRLKPRSILELAMLLALIRPGKRHLIHKCETQGWQSIEREIWTVDANQAFSFKKSHSLAYAHTIVIQLNLLIDTLENQL